MSIPCLDLIHPANARLWGITIPLSMLKHAKLFNATSQVETIWLILSLVGGWATPLKKIVSWDDDIPNIWKNNSHVPNHRPVMLYIYNYIYTVYIYPHDIPSGHLSLIQIAGWWASKHVPSAADRWISQLVWSTKTLRCPVRCGDQPSSLCLLEMYICIIYIYIL